VNDKCPLCQEMVPSDQLIPHLAHDRELLEKSSIERGKDELVQAADLAIRVVSEAFAAGCGHKVGMRLERVFGTRGRGAPGPGEKVRAGGPVTADDSDELRPPVGQAPSRDRLDVAKLDRVIKLLGLLDRATSRRRA